MLIVVLDWVLGEKVGVGTICNMLFIGIFMYLLKLNNLVPTFHNVIARIIMMLLGMFIIRIGSYFYISTGIGSGPRDGLMIALTKRTEKYIRYIRNSIEFSVLVVGYFLFLEDPETGSANGNLAAYPLEHNFFKNPK
ncbi:hypothetical protein [Clostridium botulinum]|uniref:hypothetical protein n=1 Tax=Clostridium botulinum TaxID=1491 RepID=UPI001363075A|nr:hypothetical protein [Clostridium botulinum]